MHVDAWLSVTYLDIPFFLVKKFVNSRLQFKLNYNCHNKWQPSARNIPHTQASEKGRTRSGDYWRNKLLFILMILLFYSYDNLILFTQYTPYKRK